MEAKQFYNTKARKYILEYLSQNRDTTVTAADISEYLDACGLSVNLTTVYRYLSRLVKERKIIKFSSEKGAGWVYQLSPDEKACDEHIHVKCINCGKLLHLDCGFMNDLKAHLAQKHGFCLKCSGSILYGLCDECNKKDRAK